MAVRCKFKCESVTKRVALNAEGYGPIYDFEFVPVYSGSEENKEYWAFTPAGKITLGSIKQYHFEPGQEYYIDFIEAK